MIRKLLLSGDRSEFTTLQFDDSKGKLSILAHYAAPHNASWVELSSSDGELDGFFGLSEGDDSGLLYTFEINHFRKTSVMTSCMPTLGAPGHCEFDLCVLSSNSDREQLQCCVTIQRWLWSPYVLTYRPISLLTNTTKYLGGSIALYPKTPRKSKEVLIESLPRTELFPPFTYQSVGHGPDHDRQRQCHPHQIIESSSGLLYVPDLGADRVWVIKRDVMKLEICGWLQCPPGTGPRHAAMSPQGISKSPTIMTWLN